MKLLKTLFFASLCLCCFYEGGASGTQLYPCKQIEGRYQYDVDQIMEVLEGMFQSVDRRSPLYGVLKNQLGILNKNFKHKRIPSEVILQSVSYEIKEVFQKDESRYREVKGYYENFQDQIKSAAQRVSEWKARDNPNNKGEQSCKQCYNGCLLGYNCIETHKNDNCNAKK